MAANETTVGAAYASGEDVNVNTPADTIKGWNDRRKSNNQIISSMVPFVQLIGIFDEQEYERMFAATQRVPVTYDDGSAVPYNEKYEVSPAIFDNIKEQIESRLINLYIMKSGDHSLNVDPIGGIVMAERVSQVKEVSEGGDPSGGVGITDLQVDYGRSNVLGSRKFSLRMTINNPAILDSRFEYSKLATFGAQFLIIYGWSNPTVVPGYDAAMFPPSLEPDPHDGRTPQRQRMVVPLRNLGNGGYWSAARVNISNYDFSFNEMGKLEINVTLRDESSVGMSSTIISSIAKKFKAFLQSDLFGQIIQDNQGNEFTLREALHARQLKLNKQAQEGEIDEAEYDSTWSDLDTLVEQNRDQFIIEGLNNNPDDVSSEANNAPYNTEESVQKMNAQKDQPVGGYQDGQNAIYSYKSKFVTVPDPNPDAGVEPVTESGNSDDEETDENPVPPMPYPTKQIIGYEKKPVYYFLGAIMDSIAISMADVKVGISSSKVPAFRYTPVNPNGKLSTAFQSTVHSINRQSSYEERIQEAIIRLKERFLPPAPRRMDSPKNYTNLRHLYNRFVGQALRDNLGRGIYVENQTGRVSTGQTRFYTELLPKAVSSTCGVFPVYEGTQTTEKTRIIRTIFPAPPQISQMVGAPMRGHVIDVNTDHYADILRNENLEPVGTMRIFLPDWKQEIQYDAEGNEVTSAGSPDGYDPLNPSEYRAAFPEGVERSTAFEEAHSMAFPRGPGSDNFEERSQEPYGRGGRFIMACSFSNRKLDDDNPSGTFTLLMTYDLWRLTSTTNWNLLQRKWHNLYIEYLSSYFERLIRTRVSELEIFGIPIEAIYNEPLDLDWLTGKIWNNNQWNNGDTGWVKPWDEIAGMYADEFDIDAEERKLNAEITKYEEIIDQNNIVIQGAGDPRAVVEGRAEAGLRSTAIGLTRRINLLKRQIEELTGGQYEVVQDVMGNDSLIRFKNFVRIEPSETEFDYLPQQFDGVPNKDGRALEGEDVDEVSGPIGRLAKYKPVIRYEYQSSRPEVTERWILWNNYNVPTDNYQNIWDEGANQFIDNDNKAERWKQQNQYAYERGVLPDFEAAKIQVDNKLIEIERLQSRLENTHLSYEEHQFAIENAEEQIAAARRTFEQFTRFFNEEGEVELSIYDDTSEFDGEGIFVPMGRAEPMHLTTKVAQQWSRKFRGLYRGAIDVRNYGPPKHGYPFQLPTNEYQFKFDASRLANKIMGQPRRVLDPGQFIDIGLGTAGSPSPIVLYVNNLLRNLAFDVREDIDNTELLSVNIPAYSEYWEGRVLKKTYQSWTAFGSPGIPNENGNNQWGFKAGPPSEDDVFEGGNYVRTYKDFLDLFNLGYNPDYPKQLKIVGKWPSPGDTHNEMSKMNDYNGNSVDEDILKENTEHGLPIYTLIDEIGNIIIEDDAGWYRPTGWRLEYSGAPVFLYPSRMTACEINDSSETVNGVPPGHVVKTGGFSDPRTVGPHDGGASNDKSDNYDRMAFEQGSIDNGFPDGNAMKGDNFWGREPKVAQKVADFIAEVGKNWWEGTMAQINLITSGFSDESIERFKKAVGKSLSLYLPIYTMFVPYPMKIGMQKLAVMAQKGLLKYGLYQSLRSKLVNQIGVGVPVDFTGKTPSWAYRIGLGQHCPNLTLDMKRSMIIFRYSTSEETVYLGNDKADGPAKDRNGNKAAPQPSNYKIAWDQLVKIGEYRYVKDKYNADGSPKLATYSEWDDSDGVRKPARGSHVIGPTKSSHRSYSNPKYPYGTGAYYTNSGGAQSRGNYTNPQTKHHGPYVFPEVNKNWLDWGDFLVGLGEENGYGYFTQIDNSNYTSCVVQPNGSITDGLEINEGFVKFVIENVFAPLPKNRRCGASTSHKPIKIKSGADGANVQNFHIKDRIDDVTYGDLFGPLRDKSEDDKPAESELGPAEMANLSSFRINNVADIPIRADVINNLLNTNNTNMSVTQFMGEILNPASIGINNVSNPQMAMRQRADGVFEVLSMSDVNWDSMADSYAHLFTDNLSAEQNLNRFPEDIIVLDFKAQDSLIENIDMNSKFDPLVSRVFRDAAVDFTKEPEALLNFLTYEGIAPDLKAYLETNYPELADKEGKKAIQIDKTTKAITINRSLFFPTDSGPEPIRTAITAFLQDNPARLNNMRALLNASQAGSSTIEGGITDSNYATTLMSNYMRKTTITIHGTTNISPFQKVLVKGIMPDLEGLYIITNTRESITPQGFQTILEGTLIRPPSQSVRQSATNGAGWGEPEQAGAPRHEFSTDDDGTVDTASDESGG